MTLSLKTIKILKSEALSVVKNSGYNSEEEKSEIKDIKTIKNARSAINYFQGTAWDLESFVHLISHIKISSRDKIQLLGLATKLKDDWD